MLFVTHAHYDAEQFDGDRDAVLAALPESGAGLVVNPGCDPDSSAAALYGLMQTAIRAGAYDDPDGHAGQLLKEN